MTKLYLIIAIFIVGCSSSPTQLINIPPIIEYDRGLQLSETRKEYFFTEEDSLSKNLLKISVFYTGKRLESETHHLSSSFTKSGTKCFYDYQDTLLVQRRSVDSEKDSTKTIYSYNEHGQLVKEGYFNYKRRMREDVGRGLGSGGCMVTEDDYERERSWQKINEINFTYDAKNRKIQYYTPLIYGGGQNRYTWTYNHNGKVAEYNSYEDDRLIWTEKYSYSELGYEMKRTWFDENGNPKHLKEKKGHTPQFTFTYKLNEDNQEIEKIVHTEKGELVSRTTTEYDGRTIRTKQYDSNNEFLDTHLYEYEEMVANKR